MSLHRGIRYPIAAIRILTILLLFPCYNISAEEVTWVTVEAVVSLDGSQADARQMALAQARQLAIAKVVGAELSFNNLYLNSRLGGSMAHAIPHGEIVKSEVLTERAALMAGFDASAPGSNFKIRLKAAVKKSAIGKNPDFRVFAVLNQGAFVDGDKMQLQIQSTMDCHLMAFVLLEDERVLKLIPSALGHDTFLPAGRRLDFPSTEDAQRGIHLRAHLSESNNLIHEAIYILALKQPFEDLSGDIKEGIFTHYDGRTAQVQSLVRQIATIPADQRAEALVYYQIRPKG